MVESLVCFTHMRWQDDARVVALMTRFARRIRVFCFEQALFDLPVDAKARLETDTPMPQLVHLVPHLPRNAPEWAARLLQEALIESVLAHAAVRAPLFWYDTPMALPFTRRFLGLGVIYDCTQDWHLARAAYPAGGPLEKELLLRADIVFARDQALFDHRHAQHHTMRLMSDGTSTAEWDRVWQKMAAVIDETLVTRLIARPLSSREATRATDH